jgi:molecular chaperone GrpE
MSHPADSQASEPTQDVKVNDRRRFHEDGTPRPEVADVGADGEVARLQQELDAARRRVDELARAYQAGERDREDFKKRVTREREQLLDVERGKVALALLEAIDQLDLALSTAVDSPLKQGVRLIRENLFKKAEATGIEVLPLEGQPFDPNLAEAADMEICTAEADDGKVVSVLRPAYALKGKVVRPGQVKVARFVKPAEA